MMPCGVVEGVIIVMDVMWSEGKGDVGGGKGESEMKWRRKKLWSGMKVFERYGRKECCYNQAWSVAR